MKLRMLPAIAPRIIVTTLLSALLLAPTMQVRASDPGGAEMVADTVLVRPCCLVATTVGSVFFLLSWPIAAISKSTKATAHALVVRPAKATFTRPLGDFDGLLQD